MTSISPRDLLCSISECIDNGPSNCKKISVDQWQDGQFVWVTDYPSSVSPSTTVWSDDNGMVYAGVANEASTNFNLKTNSVVYQLDLAKLVPTAK